MTHKIRILVLNGPNLNMLGMREPKEYGKTSLKEINEQLLQKAKDLDIDIVFFQSNSEGEIVSHIQKMHQDNIDGLIINAGAYTHTSIAIRDAILAVGAPFVEVHITNIFSRENFRHRSYLSDIAIGVISGFGAYGYQCALEILVKVLKQA